MDAQRKLRNLLSYTKTDSVEELEDCNKLYEELLSYINKQEKFMKLLDLYRETAKNQTYENFDYYRKMVNALEKELGEMK